MAIAIRPLHPSFAAEVTGVDLRRPLDDATVAAIRAAFNDRAVLAFPGQPLTDDQQIAFSLRFGPLEKTITSAMGGTAVISNLSNTDAEGRLYQADDARALFLSGNQRWHSDSSFKVVPAMASLLSAREVPPEGGETEYADMRAAYDALNAATRRRLEGLEAEHSYGYSQGQISLAALTEGEMAALPPVRHPVVRSHNETGRKVLYIGRHASHIVGLAVEEGRALLDDLLAHGTQDRFVYRHRWRVGDLVMWDNRAVLHRGRPWDQTKYARIMHRTTVAGEAASNPWRIEAAAAV